MATDEVKAKLGGFPNGKRKNLFINHRKLKKYNTGDKNSKEFLKNIGKAVLLKSL